MDITDMIRAVQGALGIETDGRAGPQTWGAIYAALVNPTINRMPSEQAISAVDPRSETAIATLLPEARPMARALVEKAAASGIQIKVISGTRSFAEQDALFAKGRTTPGPKGATIQGARTP